VERFSFGRFAGDASQRVHSIVSAAESEASGLLRDAEREADLIRREGQAEAERILDEARVRADDLVAERRQRIGELSDGIVEQTEMLFDRIDAADHVRRQLDSLLRSLGEAAEAVSREASARRPAPRAASQAARPAAPPAPRAEPLARREPPPPVRPAYREPAPAPAPVPAPEPRRPEPLRSAPAQVADTDRRAEDPGDARFDGARLVALQMAVAGSTREEVHAELQRAFRLPDPSSILDDVFGARRAGAAS
jgi:vacuolar-type H+-ATPase subunit H